MGFGLSEGFIWRVPALLNAVVDSFTGPGDLFVGIYGDFNHDGFSRDVNMNRNRKSLPGSLDLSGLHDTPADSNIA